MDKELKSVQTLILLTPSMKANLRKLAYMNRMSLSVFVSHLIEDYAAEHPELITEYDRIFERNDRK